MRYIDLRQERKRSRLRRLAERLFTWIGTKLYGADWPPILIVVLKQETSIEELEAPKVFH